MKLTPEQKQAKIKEIERELKALRKEQKKIHQEQIKLQKQRAKQKPNLTPEQKQILTLTKEMQVLKFAVRTLILKDIETIKALKTYEKMIKALSGKFAELEQRSRKQCIK